MSDLTLHTNGTFPAIPAVTNDPTSLMNAVNAIKESVEMLVGVRGTGVDRAVLVNDLRAQTRKPNPSPHSSALDLFYADVDNLTHKLQNLHDEAIKQVKNNIQTADIKLQEAVNEIAGLLKVVNEVRTATSGNTAAITVEQAQRVTADEAITGQLDTITSTVAGNAAAISAEQLTRTTRDSALAGTLNTLTSITGGVKSYAQSTAPTSPHEGDIWVDTAHGGLIKYYQNGAWVTDVDPAFAVTAAVISKEAITRTEKDDALSATVDKLVSVVAGNSATLTTESSTRTTPTTALAGQITSLSTTVSNNAAAISQEATTRSAADGALASTMTTVQAQSNAGTANGLVRMTAASTSDTGVAAEYQIQVSASGSSYASTGLRLQAKSDGTSRVVIDATQFYMRAGTNNYTPFAIDSASNLVANFNIDSGNVTGLGAFATLAKIQSNNIATYMDTGVIATAYIGDLQVSTIKIGANAVTVPQVFSTQAVVYGNGSNQLLCELYVTLSSAGYLEAQFFGSQAYQGSVPDTTINLYIDGSLISGVSNGGGQAQTSIALGGMRYLGAGQHYLSVYWYGATSAVSIGNINLIGIGAMK